jgi:hypothetical protein
MSTPTLPPKLRPLIEYLNGLTALRAMQKFSITGAPSEEWRPPVFEVTHGEGI